MSELLFSNHADFIENGAKSVSVSRLTYKIVEINFQLYNQHNLINFQMQSYIFVVYY